MRNILLHIFLLVLASSVQAQSVRVANYYGDRQAAVSLTFDDGVQEQSEIQAFDLKQFHGIFLKGKTETDPCYYACLMTKDAGSVFYISIIYNRTEDKVVDRILKSFQMEEEMVE